MSNNSKPDIFNGSIYSSDNYDFNKTFEKSNIVICNFNHKDIHHFKEQCSKLITPSDKITCLMVLHLDLTTDTNIINILENVKLSCTYYANQFSIIIARCYKTNKFYWIRGIRWFHEKVYNFGDEFSKSDFDKTIDGVVKGELAFPKITGNDVIYFMGKPTNITDIMTTINSMNFDELADIEDHLIELFIQISVNLNSANFKKFKINVIEAITSKQKLQSMGPKKELLKLINAQNDGDDSKETQKLIEQLRSDIKKNRACSKLKNMTNTILSVVHQGGAASRKACMSFENTLRAEKVKGNVSEVNKMTFEDINEYLEGIDQFIMGQLESGRNGVLIKEMLNDINNGRFVKRTLNILKLHSKCPSLDGFTLSILAETIKQNNVSHDMKGVLAVLCGNTETISSIPIAIDDTYSNIDDPTKFSFVENAVDNFKYRILLRRMICEASMNRERNISPGSKHLSYFIIAMLMSLANSIKEKFSSIPDNPEDFTVIAMRNLLGYIFTTLAAGEQPMSTIWKTLSSYPTKIPSIEGFKKNELWIVKNLIDMFPYCVWNKATKVFKKNLLIGVVKLLRSEIVTDEFKQIDADKKEALNKKLEIIAKELTTVWQWQKEVIIIILKINKNKDIYTKEFIKAFAKTILNLYPDIDEEQISNNHRKSNSSSKLKIILNNIISTGVLNLTGYQLNTIRDIISKRMHAYYYDMSKEERKDYFYNMSLDDLTEEWKKIITPSKSNNINKEDIIVNWNKSWCHSQKYSDNILDINSTNEKIKQMISEIETTLGYDVITETDAAASGAGAAAAGADAAAAGVIVDKFPDLRQAKWLEINEVSKITEYTRDNDMSDIVPIISYVFDKENTYLVIIDIIDIILTNYKDTAKIYSLVIDKYA